MDLSLFTFGERIRFCRRRAGLTQEQLASAIGVHESTICRWEREQQSFEMALRHFLKIAEVTQTAVADFLVPPSGKRGLLETE